MEYHNIIDNKMECQKNIMCGSCYINKPSNEFYKGTRKCKECTRSKNKKAYREYYAKNGRTQNILGFGLKVLFT